MLGPSLALALAATDTNLLSLENGGVPVVVPPTYGGAWSVGAMLDGNPSTGWCSTSGAGGPFEFVFQLEQRSLLTSVEINNSGAEESSNPGISARKVEISISTPGSRDDFKTVARLNLPKSGRAAVRLPPESVGSLVKVVIASNWGDATYTELMELAVLGHGLEPAPWKSPKGTWRLDHGALLKLSEEAGTVTGCEVQEGGGRVWLGRGAMRGRATALEWTEPGATGASARSVLLVAADGKLHGDRRADGTAATWGGEPWTGPAVDCQALSDEHQLLKRLEQSDEPMVLRGVGFDGDELKVDPLGELAVLRRAMSARVGPRLRIIIYGRAGDPAADELKRCERRAQRVLQYLQAAGVDAQRVDLGFGLLKVGAAVQMEPRIEVQKVKAR